MPAAYIFRSPVLAMVLALASGSGLLLAACAGGGEEAGPQDVTAAVKPEQLDAMMLQPEDLPPDFSYELGTPVPETGPVGEPQQRTAGRHLRALLAEGLRGEGKTVCIGSDIGLYESVEAAATRWRREWQAIEEAAAAVPSGEGKLEKLALPALGDESDGFFLSAPRVSFCGWQSVPALVVSVAFRKGRLLADVSTYTLGQGASREEVVEQAIELARRLLARIEGGLGQ